MKRRHPSRSEDEESTAWKKSKYEEEEDDDDDEEESEMDISAIEAMIPSQVVPTQSVNEADAGIIDKVSLIDFMCHRKLDVSLHPNVNFILGQNGSGKSAIMAGIVVGLGGAARHTERGSSLKQFIRSGQSSSEIKIHLRNRGKEAYRPEVYGQSIIVERTIRKDGTGSYKIKNSKGKIISDKKEELIHVLDNCSIQVDNPVSLLNQDTSRHFLQKSNPKDKYKLFMKATLLEQIACDYERAEEEQKRMKEGIQQQRSLLPVYEANAKELEEKVETFKRLSGLEGKVDQLMKELQWAMVAEIRQGIKPIEKDIASTKQRIPRNQTKKEQALEYVKKFKKKEEKVEQDLKDVMLEADSLTKERDSCVFEKRSIEKEERDLTLNKLKVIKKQIEESVNEKRCLEITREACIQASQRDTAGEREARTKRLEECQKMVARLEGDIATADNDRRQFDAEVKRRQTQRDEIAQKIDRLNEDIQSSDRRLKQLNSSHSRGLATFGQDMEALVHAIHQNSRRFSRPPIGPLGSEIKLKDYSWATAVEQAIKRGMLNAFVVDSHKDEAVLRQLINSVYKRGYKPDVICSPYQNTLYDVSRNCPRCSYPTVLDMLETCNPNVINVLIDQAGIESVLLIEERATAHQVIVNQRVAKGAFTKEGDEVVLRGHYSNKQGKLGIIQESVESAVREERSHLDALRADIDKLGREQRQVDEQVDRNRRSVVEAVRKIKRKNDEKRKLNSIIEELKNAEDEEEPEEDIATYDNEIAEIEEKLKELREKRQGAEQELQALKKKKTQCSVRNADCEGRVEQVRQRVVALRAEIGDCSHKKREAEQKVKFFQDRMDKIQSDVRSLESKIAKLRLDAGRAEEKAKEVSQPIETKRSRRNIQSEIDKLKKILDQKLPQLAEREEVEKEYLEAMDLYSTTAETIAGEEDALKTLHESLDLRRNKYLDLLERMSVRVKYFFSHFLNQRDYAGSIRFSHDKERLDINVKTDRHTSHSKSTKNPKALSGGERSFTTVCFIISLWEVIEAPFRCLDEFDVFMDMMNRRISMSLMLEHAKTQSNRQFIFFTPQDMSAMGIKPKDQDRQVKVLRLLPPERGQATLTLQE